MTFPFQGKVYQAPTWRWLRHIEFNGSFACAPLVWFMPFQGKTYTRVHNHVAVKCTVTLRGGYSRVTVHTITPSVSYEVGASLKRRSAPPSYSTTVLGVRARGPKSPCSVCGEFPFQGNSATKHKANPPQIHYVYLPPP